MSNPDRPNQSALKPILKNGQVIGFTGPDGSADYANSPSTEHSIEQNNPAGSNQTIENQPPINQPGNQE